MPQREDTENYREIFLNDSNLLDCRAPVEFCRGAFPTAYNLPLMNDAEREQVGICYKQAGQQAAIELGQTLVSGPVKQERLELWTRFVGNNPSGYLYCFRGGLRSQTVQQWLSSAGVHYPLVLGGYKAMRTFLLEELPRSLAVARMILISGKTGTGKTRVIEAIRAVDLEGLARHRGSSFGDLLDPQPSQIDFENALSIALMKLLAGGDNTLVLEDEGHLIGRVALPSLLTGQMRVAPMLVVEESVSNRVEVVLEDYIKDLGRRFAAAHGAQGPQRHRDKLLSDLGRIRKRLGGKGHREIEMQMQQAFDQQDQTGNIGLHRHWIESLLVQYYDPMYEYQLGKREGDILARGDRGEIIARARALTCSKA